MVLAATAAAAQHQGKGNDFVCAVDCAGLPPCTNKSLAKSLQRTLEHMTFDLRLGDEFDQYGEEVDLVACLALPKGDLWTTWDWSPKSHSQGARVDRHDLQEGKIQLDVRKNSPHWG